MVLRSVPEQGWNHFRRGARPVHAVDEDDVAAYAERWEGVRARATASSKAGPVAISVAEVSTPASVEFGDCAVDTARKAEIVRVEDEAGGHQAAGRGKELVGRDDAERCSGTFASLNWWAERDSNPRHPACKAGALTN